MMNVCLNMNDNFMNQNIDRKTNVMDISEECKYSSKNEESNTINPKLLIKNALIAILRIDTLDIYKMVIKLICNKYNYNIVFETIINEIKCTNIILIILSLKLNGIKMIFIHLTVLF